MPLIQNPVDAVSACLEPVSDIAKTFKSACILVCDITRPVPNGLFLRQLINQLIAGGIGLDRICILIATGLHRPNEGVELQKVIGDAGLADLVEVVNHHATDSSEHLELGETQSGTPIALDRRFVEADLKIATGLVEPHFMAGWSGGRKVILPGVASSETIRCFHSARFLEDPLARGCNLEGNPLHLEQLEVLQMLRQSSGREIYAINTVIDEYRRLGFINFGEIESSHLEATRFADQYCVVDVDQTYETVLTSSAGYPLDLTYYQTVKSMVTPLPVLAENATLIVASECAEGLGSDAYRESQTRMLQEGPDAFMKRIRLQQFAAIDEWECEMQLKATNHAVVKLFSEGLVGEDRDLTGVDMIDSVQDALDESISKSSQGSVAIIPEGPYVVPRLSLN